MKGAGLKGTGLKGAGKPEAPAAATVSAPDERFPIVGVGASAGGLEAFTELLAHLPSDTGLAFVLIQHMDPTHASMLPELLGRATKMPVVEVRDGMRIAPDKVYVIPSGATARFDDGVVRLVPRPKAGGRYLPIDQFMSSLAQTRRTRAIGVILSGTMSDGALGMRAIKAEGGVTFAQDEASSKFPDMPRAAIAIDSVDRVLPPREIAQELARIGGHSYLHDTVKVEQPEEPEAAPVAESSELAKIFQLLRRSTGVDFSHYRPTTIRRRVARRMLLNKVDSFQEYARLLGDESGELRSLYEDILISVTAFFRDPEAFRTLKTVVFPAILRNRSAETPVRLWVPGCATGEEVYSIAIVLFEQMAEAGVNPPVQLFATDISEKAMEKARAGFYLESALTDVSPERLRRFFVRADGGYRVSRPIRDVCVFARQNVASDPPFSNLDLISCRNLLIYMEPVLQQRIIPLFHYALKPEGFLMLGSAESIAKFPDLFDPVDRGRQIFVKRPGSERPPMDFDQTSEVDSPRRTPAHLALDLTKEADRVALDRYAPPGVIVNDALEIVQFRGRTAPYLEAPSGTPIVNVLKMAREGLLVELRSAVIRARSMKSRVRVEGIRIRQSKHRDLELAVEVIPIESGDSGNYYLVVFEDRKRGFARRAGRMERPKPKPRSRAAREGGIVRLEQELSSTREYLQSIIEEQAASNEELKAANEEILSSNEELQSTNEELETAKEELQSTNEELTTVNDELQNRSLELAQANSDLVNVLTSTGTAIVMVGPDGRVRRFTPAAEKLLNLIPADVGRRLGDLKPNLELPDLAEKVERVIATATRLDREVRTGDGHWFAMRIVPYRTLDNRNEGAVILFFDVDPLKRAQEARVASDASYRRLFENAREAVWLLDAETGEILDANPFVTELFGFPRQELIGRKPWELPLYDDPEAAQKRFASLRKAGHSYETDFGMRTRDGRPLQVEAVRTVYSAGGRSIVQSNMRDVTERRILEEELRQVQKLESIGRLAGGIAHDFNNILNIISAYATLLARGGEAEKREQSAAAIETAIQRGAALVRQLLTFARREGTRFETVDVNELVRELASMLNETFPKNVRVTLDLKQDVPPIKADASQLHQALLNLAVNARDAMAAGGGELTISTALANIEKLRSRFPDAGDDRYVCLGVTDQGTGMDEETRQRIFEPFFTTKDKQDGSGLGLAVVYGVVNAHSGFVEVVSERGKGTSFSIYLPVRALEGPAAEPPSKAAEETAANGETILVVEDEELLLDSMKTLIEAEGYKVLTARDGIEAVEAFQEHVDSVGLVVADLGLPRLGGWDALLEMRKRNPALRAIIASGTIGTGQRALMRKAGVELSIRKPFTATEMIGAIRRALRPPAAH